jgi:hypothetical protein
MAEIRLLSRCQKKLNAIHQFLDVHQQHGLDGEEFKTTHDMIITGLALEPTVELVLPPHLVYSRHAMDIRSTTSIERFLHCISSQELHRRGVTNLVIEQVFR